MHSTVAFTPAQVAALRAALLAKHGQDFTEVDDTTLGAALALVVNLENALEDAVIALLGRGFECSFAEYGAILATLNEV